jgi:hypothetical protein
MPGPQLVVNSTLPTAVALFGTTIGYRKFTESIYVEADQQLTVPAVSRTLAQKGIDLTTLVVTNPYTGAVFDENQDYTVVLVGGTQGTSEALYAVSRVIDGGTILSGDTVTVSYRYTDPDYFNPFVFYDYDDVRTAYGEPFNLTSETVNGVAPGGVLSELTLAAKFAFMNGAYQVVCVAVQPDDPESPVVAEYVAALEKLNDQALVALVVPCNGGMQPLNEQVRQHVVTQSANRFERRAIIGMDGSISSDQRRTYANQIGEQRIALVSPTKFTYYSPELNKSIELGGQYLAASLAGMTVSMSYAQPLTHKVITGWERILDLDQLPPPAFGLLEMEDYFASAAEGRSVKLYTSRGCTFDCSFCSVPFTSQRRFVAHSPERVCAEIDRLVEKYAISHVMFEDDNMGLNRRRFDRILSLIIERGHHLTLAARNLRADLLNDETLALMKRAGFEKVWVTPESGSQRVLDEVIGKKMDLGCVVDTIDRIQRQGMSVAAAFVMGLPGESLSEIHDTLQFARGLRERGVGEFWFSIATPIEGSRIFNNLRAAGRIDGMDLDRFSYCLGSYDGDDYTADHLAKLRQEIMLECNAPAGR